MLVAGVDAVDRGLDFANGAHVWVVTEHEAVEGRTQFSMPVDGMRL